MIHKRSEAFDGDEVIICENEAEEEMARRYYPNATRYTKNEIKVMQRAKTKFGEDEMKKLHTIKKMFGGTISDSRRVWGR